MYDNLNYGEILAENKDSHIAAKINEWLEQANIQPGDIKRLYEDRRNQIIEFCGEADVAVDLGPFITFMIALKNEMLLSRIYDCETQDWVDRSPGVPFKILIEPIEGKEDGEAL